MQPTFRVVVNRNDERCIAEPEEADELCAELAHRPVFTANVLGERGQMGPTLDGIVESGRAFGFRTMRSSGAMLGCCETHLARTFRFWRAGKSAFVLIRASGQRQRASSTMS